MQNIEQGTVQWTVSDAQKKILAWSKAQVLALKSGRSHAAMRLKSVLARRTKKKVPEDAATQAAGLELIAFERAVSAAELAGKALELQPGGAAECIGAVRSALENISNVMTRCEQHLAAVSVALGESKAQATAKRAEVEKDLRAATNPYRVKGVAPTVAFWMASVHLLSTGEDDDEDYQASSEPVDLDLCDKWDVPHRSIASEEEGGVHFKPVELVFS